MRKNLNHLIIPSFNMSFFIFFGEDFFRFFSVFFVKTIILEIEETFLFFLGPDVDLLFEKYGVCPEPPKKTVNSESYSYIPFYRGWVGDPVCNLRTPSLLCVGASKKRQLIKNCLFTLSITKNVV